MQRLSPSQPISTQQQPLLEEVPFVTFNPCYFRPRSALVADVNQQILVDPLAHDRCTCRNMLHMSNTDNYYRFAPQLLSKQRWVNYLPPIRPVNVKFVHKLTHVNVYVREIALFADGETQGVSELDD